MQLHLVYMHYKPLCSYKTIFRLVCCLGCSHIFEFFFHSFSLFNFMHVKWPKLIYFKIVSCCRWYVYNEALLFQPKFSQVTQLLKWFHMYRCCTFEEFLQKFVGNICNFSEINEYFVYDMVYILISICLLHFLISFVFQSNNCFIVVDLIC